MRTLAIVALVSLLGACSSTESHSNAPNGSSASDGRITLESIQEMRHNYENQRRLAAFDRRTDGRTNALNRDLGHITNTIDRHLFNYSPTDPYVNVPTDRTYGGTLFYTAIRPVTTGFSDYADIGQWDYIVRPIHESLGTVPGNHTQVPGSNFGQ